MAVLAPVTDWIRRLPAWLVRRDVAVWLILAVMALTVVGSLFPQIPANTLGEPAQEAALREAVRQRYGALAEVVIALGLLNFGSSPLAVALLTPLLAATALCTVRRWRAVRRQIEAAPVRATAARLDNAPIAVTVPAAPGATPHEQADRLGPLLARRGYGVRREEGADAVHVRADRHRWSGLGTLVNHLALLMLAAGAVVTAALAWQESLTVTQGRAASPERRPGLAIRNEGFEILRNPDGSPAQFEARVTLSAPGAAPAQHVVRVNEPIRYGGTHIFLNSYGRDAGGAYVEFIVGDDPGYWPFAAGGILMLIGMTWILYWPASTIYARVTADGVRLAAVGSRWAYGLDRRVREIAVALGAEKEEEVAA
jgi:cytochrome c biogenesis protein ResB